MLGTTYRITRLVLPQHGDTRPEGRSRAAKNPRTVTQARIRQVSPNKIVKREDENKENFIRNKKYAKILHDCSTKGVKFVDEDFPAASVSLYRSSLTRGTVSEDEKQFFRGAKSIINWNRPENIRMKGEITEWVLFSDPRPSDICQGEIGNCWLVAALTLIAERKELLAKILGSTVTNEFGAYLIRLFKDGVWKDVIVDDCLPCDSFQRLVFSSCRGRQLWVPLIEKAMAKLHGSYESLQSGSIWDGLNYLTGYVSERIYLKSEEDRELLWGRLLSFSSCGFLMGASITTSKNVEKLYEEKGLVANHVYSILQVMCHEKTRLVQLRNPWGRFSWKGEWSDSSSLWSESMRRKFSPNQSHEGIFWMSFDNFMRYFTCIDVCKVRQGWKTYSMDGIFPPFADPDCQPLFEIICDKKTCEVDISLYQSSKRNSHEIVQLNDIGFLVFELDARTSQDIKLLRPVEFAKSAQRRCVTTTLMMTKGKYCVIPFSFGNWTDEKTFHPFTLTIQASHEIKCRTITPSHSPHILSDAMISCANKYGNKKGYSKQGVYDDVSTFSVNLGLGYCTIVENGSKYFLEFEMTSKTNPNYTSTRGSLVTCDRVPPHHRQVIQVLTAKDAKKPGRISNSYQLQILDTQNEALHTPPLNDRVSGLHTPRPFSNGIA